MTEPGAASPAPAAGFRFLGERDVHQGPVIRVTEGRVEGPDGQELVREVVRHPGAVAVVPLDGDEVVLVRQYRAAADAWLLEIPAGKRDVDGEPPEVTAARELEEEVGLRAASLELVARFYNSVGFSDEYTYVYAATDLEAVPDDRQGPEEEAMTVERFPLGAVTAMIERAELQDAKTVVGLQAALLRLGR